MRRIGPWLLLWAHSATVLAAPAAPPQVTVAEVRADAFADLVEALGTLLADAYPRNSLFWQSQQA